MIVFPSMPFPRSPDKSVQQIHVITTIETYGPSCPSCSDPIASPLLLSYGPPQQHCLLENSRYALETGEDGHLGDDFLVSARLFI